MNHQTFKVCLPCDTTKLAIELPPFGTIFLFFFGCMCLYAIYKLIKLIKNKFNSICTFHIVSRGEEMKLVELCKEGQCSDCRWLEEDEISGPEIWAADAVKKLE
ncbi:hypothetical protein OCU04_007574 [Sclerotinia nivalis]|uniref:Uncharacterized protein n=1 Tax=Sclerotinia nivalis TaxID=352851 RepID=A0A9X0AJ21_9HELO|nr:hypothetical protein OCU04_007574 [Sclerotinia nivalis]